MNPTVLIIAIDTEEHFLPLSTQERPKQLLNLFFDITLLHKMVDCMVQLIDPEKIFIAANIAQSNAIINELPFIPEKNIIIQPSFKDTAAAIGYSSLYIDCYYPDSEIIVMNTQQSIKYETHFCDTINKAIKEARLYNIIASLGVQPNQLNSGIYVFNFDTIINEYQEYLPNHYQILMEIEAYIRAGLYGELLADEISLYFESLEVVPIEYGIMEHSSLVKCIPYTFNCDLNDFTDKAYQNNDERINRYNNLLNIHTKAKANK
jgi:mannose-1-phosphate guanylyltransferase